MSVMATLLQLQDMLLMINFNKLHAVHVLEIVCESVLKELMK
jgi:hypothetical protein